MTTSWHRSVTLLVSRQLVQRSYQINEKIWKNNHFWTFLDRARLGVSLPQVLLRNVHRQWKIRSELCRLPQTVVIRHSAQQSDKPPGSSILKYSSRPALLAPDDLCCPVTLRPSVGAARSSSAFSVRFCITAVSESRELSKMCSHDNLHPALAAWGVREKKVCVCVCLCMGKWEKQTVDVGGSNVKWSKVKLGHKCEVYIG